MNEMRKALFPALREEDIHVYIDNITEEGGNVVLYITGEIVSIYFDEVFGPMNWSKENKIIQTSTGNKFMCTITATDDSNNTASKDGLGTISKYDEDKGEETDALKRAAYQWGLGRELKHHLPRLTFPRDYMSSELKREGSSSSGVTYRCSDEFIVQQVVYSDADTIDRRIVKLAILNKTTNKNIIFDIEEELKKTRERLDNAAKKRGTPKTSKKNTTTQPNLLENKIPEDLGTTVITLPGQLEGKKLNEIHPQQVLWLYKNKDTSTELKETCLKYANTKESIKILFIQNGLM